MQRCYSIIALLLAVASTAAGEGLSEAYRVEEHDKRYPPEWPPAKYVPDTPGWKRLMDERFRQGRD